MTHVCGDPARERRMINLAAASLCQRIADMGSDDRRFFEDIVQCKTCSEAYANALDDLMEDVPNPTTITREVRDRCLALLLNKRFGDPLP